MSHWMPHLQDAIWNRLSGDTGTGGLFNSTTALVGGLYYGMAPENAPFPHLVLRIPGVVRDDTAKNRKYQYECEVDIRVSRTVSLGQRPLTTDDGAIRMAAIMERLEGDWDQQSGHTSPSYGLEHWIPSNTSPLPDSPAWTYLPIVFQSCADNSDDQAFFITYTFRGDVQRT